MSADLNVESIVDRAAETVGPVWPLHSFVTANPLAGFEDRPFHEAVRTGNRVFGGQGYPDPSVFRRAWETGRIDPDRLTDQLRQHGDSSDPEQLLSRMETDDPAGTTGETDTSRVDELLSKWLSVFLDQGQAEWSMPNRERGFYAAFRSVAPHDREIPDRSTLTDRPEEPAEAIEQVLSPYPRSRWQSLLEHHLTALPGWTGLIRQQAADGTDWQSARPVTLLEYLAVRLTLVDLTGADVEPPETEAPATGDPESGPEEGPPLAELWLTAWEETYREELLDRVAAAGAAATDGADGRPDAQFVFCIDTRSERIRRHVEAAGQYETHGYAGFFGIPMRYRGYGSEVTVDACPPVLDAKHQINDCPTGHPRRRERHDRWSRASQASRELLDSLQSNAATAFSFVESAGIGYGLALVARTLFPARVFDLLAHADRQVPDDHEFCAPAVERDTEAGHALPAGLTLKQRVEYAATAFDLMGWEQFARVVVFAGHASQTANNPFDSSLDCGACAGSPGGPSARVLAAICNETAVRERLRDRGFDIPGDTVFVAGQHNTTTDAVDLYAGSVPESHEADIDQLRVDLESARTGAATERVANMGADPGVGPRDTERRAADWAETRPEWGLAGNAALVVGPRELTEGLDLDGRAFLHSYDWSTDPNGEALSAILAGPMVVTQWINSQYYFATVDPAVYGSGSKVTHNPVGNVGVYQGNGGDLMRGLPLQSLVSADDEPYHQPLRLSAVVQAPVERVTDVLADNGEVTTLLDNNWLSLTVIDPQQDHRAFHYDGDLNWTPRHDDSERRSDRCVSRSG